MNNREESLPKWAQDIIKGLRVGLRMATEPLTKELNALRPKVELLKTRNDALRELLECAAKGGHITSAEILQVIEGYGLCLVPEEGIES